MEKMRMETNDQAIINLSLLVKIFPNCITEGLGENGQPERKVDWEKLKLMFGQNRILIKKGLK